MVNCLKDHYSTTGKIAGFKPAGGIRTPGDAKAYLDLMIQALVMNKSAPIIFELAQVHSLMRFE